LGTTSFEEHAPKLKFVKNKSAPYAYMVSTPANLGRPIPEDEAKLIIESLN
jgi:predicted RNA-binding protein